MQTCIASCLVLQERDTLRVHATQYKPPSFDTFFHNITEKCVNTSAKPSAVTQQTISIDKPSKYIIETLERLETYTRHIFDFVVHPTMNAKIHNTDALRNLREQLWYGLDVPRANKLRCRSGRIGVNFSDSSPGRDHRDVRDHFESRLMERCHQYGYTDFPYLEISMHWPMNSIVFHGIPSTITLWKLSQQLNLAMDNLLFSLPIIRKHILLRQEKCNLSHFAHASIEVQRCYDRRPKRCWCT